jgi:signal transduction histidine kinase
VSVIRTLAQNPRGELVLYFCASAAVVLVLVIAAAAGSDGWFSTTQLRLVLMTSIAVGLIVAGATLLGWAPFAEEAVDRSAEIASLRRSLQTSEAVIKAEPQVLVFWERGEPLRVVAHTLASVPGLPEAVDELQRFGTWLEPSSAAELKSGLDALFADGRPFNLLVRTRAGAHLEADGRAAGGRAILRLRDVVGYRSDLSRILDQHRALTREVRTSRALLNALPIPIWQRDPAGVLSWVNDAYLQAVEAQSIEEVQRSQIELLETRQRDRIRAAVAEGGVYRERLPLVSAGQLKPHDVVSLPLDDASAGAAIDVADIESAQGELDRHLAAYDRTLHRVATGVAIFGPDRRLTFFNDAYRRIFQIDPDWLATHPSDGEILDRLRELSRLPQVVNYRDWKAKLLAAVKGDSAFEDWWHLLDGRTLQVVGEQRPDGGITYLFDDATERLALESRYNAMIDAQRETLDSLKEAVAVFAPDGRLQLYNSAFVRIWRIARPTLAEGPHIDAIIAQCTSLYDDQRTWGEISRAVTGITDRRAPLEGQMLRPDQSVIDYSLSPLPDGATLITFSDVTDSKRYERALLERNDALVAADRLKTQFLSHVSYELRTPLTNIIGFSEFMASPRVGTLNEKQREYLGDISNSSKALLAIINDILDLATIDAGGLELKVAPVKVRPIIDAALLGVKDRAKRRQIDFDVRVDEAVDTFVADESRVRQILYNLLSNAIGFSRPNDTIRVGCWRDAGMLAFTIEDQGVGIPLDQQAKIFEPFESRAQGSGHRGAGLGLSIVKSLVDLHGGNITLESEPGRGTRVTVRLPEVGVEAGRAVSAVV